MLCEKKEDKPQVGVDGISMNIILCFMLFSHFSLHYRKAKFYLPLQIYENGRKKSLASAFIRGTQPRIVWTR